MFILEKLNGDIWYTIMFNKVKT